HLHLFGEGAREQQVRVAPEPAPVHPHQAETIGDPSEWRAAPGRDRQRFCRFSTRSVTTPGSARVEVSPRAPNSFSAILRRMRRMILPERVLGRPGANWMRSGEAIGPISLRTQLRNSVLSASLAVSPAIRVT